MRRTVATAALLVAAALPLTACAAGAGEGPPGPEAPAGLTVHAGTATSVHVMWNRADAGEDISGYEVYRDGERVTEVPGEKYMVDVKGLKPSARYTFTVRAKDADGNFSPYSREVTVTTLSDHQDETPPTRPDGLTARADGSRAATLTWQEASDDTGVTSYDVLQSGTRIHSVTGDSTSALITGLRPETAYRFTVQARDAAGNVSPASPAAALTTAAGSGGGESTAPDGFRAVADEDGQHLELSWVPPDTGVRTSEYEIHLDGKFATTLVWDTSASEERVTHRLHVGGEPGTRHTVKIRAKLPDGHWGGFTPERTVTMADPAPSG
ncbi:fibronectin type III domain-containing protein [Streptomyces sp. TRM 70351]|uniref:fibronectin type III domain-containing protein n=1 Tax=Streptomyces sp. TRM 70351 TaxID=3116552 RepID=UPI002E7BBD44|nr:fibronectin type III domain-containing protein [Streptomyces sp. TRM 70351]MEE1927099.1 fibronectin type III domain-containing protein [Streptomyces sp. TRM 70351]